jgi:hypothetical protein
MNPKIFYGFAGYLIHVQLKTGWGVQKGCLGRSRQLVQKAFVNLNHCGGQLP